MNWTGGNLTRHSRDADKDLAQRQRGHFAKLRTRLRDGRIIEPQHEMTNLQDGTLASCSDESTAPWSCSYGEGSAQLTGANANGNVISRVNHKKFDFRKVTRAPELAYINDRPYGNDGPVFQDRLCHKVDAPQQIHIRLSRRESSLSAQRHRLLEYEDWLGLVSRTRLNLDSSKVEMRMGAGKRKRLCKLGQTNLQPSPGTHGHVPNRDRFGKRAYKDRLHPIDRMGAITTSIASPARVRRVETPKSELKAGESAPQDEESDGLCTITDVDTSKTACSTAQMNQGNPAIAKLIFEHSCHSGPSHDLEPSARSVERPAHPILSRTRRTPVSAVKTTRFSDDDQYVQPMVHDALDQDTEKSQDLLLKSCKHQSDEVGVSEITAFGHTHEDHDEIWRRLLGLDSSRGLNDHVEDTKLSAVLFGPSLRSRRDVELDQTSVIDTVEISTTSYNDRSSGLATAGCSTLETQTGGGSAKLTCAQVSHHIALRQDISTRNQWEEFIFGSNTTDAQ